VEVEDIILEPTPPPQLIRTVIQRSEEFEMLEEGEVDAEAKRLNADLSAMNRRIQVIMKNSGVVVGKPVLVSLNLHICRIL
jgi:hypothetical protein